MRTPALLLLLTLSDMVAACGDSPSTGDDAPGATITITTDAAPLLVAVRDGRTAAWEPATMKTPTRFEAEVSGPYTVTVVCGADGAIDTRQMSNTLDDDHTVDVSCVFPTPSGHAVTGHMVQAGFVRLAGENAQSTTAEWDFSLTVPNGTYDLIATSADRIAVRRGLAVSADLAVTPAVDLAEDGTALVGVAFTVPNAVAGETLQASVGLLNATNPDIPARIYLGAPETAKAAPDAALIASDTQSVSLRAIGAHTSRSLRRPFRIGGDTAFTVPDAVGALRWTVAGGELSASWTSLPAFDLFSLDAFGNAAAGGGSASHSVGMSARFAAATATTELTFDTDIPGYDPAWKINFAQRYDRNLFAQQGAELAVLSTVSVTETVNEGPAATHEARPVRLRHAREGRFVRLPPCGQSAGDVRGRGSPARAAP